MEGPSLVILKEELSLFLHQSLLRSEGSAPVDLKRLSHSTLKRIKTWGKLLLLEFPTFYLRVHFLMFGSYWLNGKRSHGAPKLSLFFETGEVHFYACSVQLHEGRPIGTYDWRTDLLSKNWDKGHVRRLVDARETVMLCDLLLDQAVFSGSGNIVKNEVLHLLHLHPLQRVKQLTPTQRNTLITTTRDYCFQFYHWKKKFELRKHWNVYKRKFCGVCQSSLMIDHLGAGNRKTYICPKCQKKRLGQIKEPAWLSKVKRSFTQVPAIRSRHPSHSNH